MMDRGNSRRKRFLWQTALLAIFTFGYFSVFSQNTTVRVTDPDANLIPAAHVTFTGIPNGRIIVVITDMNGHAVLPDTSEFDNLLAIKVSYLGFETAYDTLQKGATLKIKLKTSSTVLDQVVITGQYAAGSTQKAVHKITVIDSKKMEALSSNNLSDLLSRELNMRVSQDNVLGSSISLQGLSGENVKILIDGVPMIGRMNGNIDISQIDLNNIERIEVVEGPLSVTYGSNALAGTINLITKKTSDKPVRVDLENYNENIGTFNFSGRVSLDKNKTYGALSLGRKFFNGWNPGDPVLGEPAPHADSSRVKLWKPRTQYLGELLFGYHLKKGNIQYRGSIFHEKIINKGYPRPPYGEYAFDDEYLTDRLDNSLKYNTKFGKSLAFDILGAYNYYQRKKLNYITDLTTLDQRLNESDGSLDTTFTDLILVRTTLSGTPQNNKWRYQTGLDLNRESVSGQRIENSKQAIGDYAAFGSLEYHPSPRWTLRPGLRVSYNTSYGSPVVPSFFAKFQIKPGMQIRGSVARGFRAPTVKELYMNFVDINHDIHGNADLKAETSLHASTHFSYAHIKSSNTYKIRGSVFYNNINNQISLAQVTNSLYTYQNIGQTQTLGVNADFQMILGHLRFNFGGSYTGIRNKLDDDTEFGKLVFSPQLTANATYGLKKIGLDISFFINYIGRLPQFTIDENDNLKEQYVDQYTLADLTFNQRLWKKRIALAVGIKNLLNVTNVGSNVTGGAHGGDELTQPIAPGRVYFIKIGLHF